MSTTCRSTLIVYGRHAMRAARLAAARGGQHGLQIMSFEQAAVLLAGGFARAIDEECLRAAIQTVIPETPMGELEDMTGAERGLIVLTTNGTVITVPPSPQTISA